MKAIVSAYLHFTFIAVTLISKRNTKENYNGPILQVTTTIPII